MFLKARPKTSKNLPLQAKRWEGAASTVISIPVATLPEGRAAVDERMAEKKPENPRHKRLAEALKRNIARRKAANPPFMGGARGLAYAASAPHKPRAGRARPP
jgi:hypothetical protein